jgi:uncharacterized surface protein with fasciclin (FAS1) repeats
MNIVETAVNHGSFKTLVAAVTAADLVGTLSSEGPFTVFAPLDDAFGELPEGTCRHTCKAREQGTIVLYFDLPCSCG